MSFLKISQEIQKNLMKHLRSKEMRDFLTKTAAAEDSGRFKMVISTEDTDRQGEIVKQDGMDTTQYLKNSVVLWAHDYKQLPIGVTEKIYKDGTRTIAEGKFAPADANPFAQQVRKLYDLSMVNAGSVGLMVNEAQGNVITKSELVEWSFVPVPANAGALKLDAMKEQGIDLELMRSKGMEITPEEDKDGEEDEDADDAEEEDETKEKGMTEDVIAAGQQLRSEKYEYVSDMWYAFDDFLCAFYSDATPIESIKTLTEELCAKLTAIAAGQEVETEAGEEAEMYMDAIIGTAIKSNIDRKLADESKLTESGIKSLEAAKALRTFMAAQTLKAGKVLSDKNRNLIQTSVDQINSCAAALQELLDATTDQGDGAKADDEAAQKQRSSPAGSTIMKDLNDFFTMRQVLRSINNITSESLAKMKNNKSLKK